MAKNFAFFVASLLLLSAAALASSPLTEAAELLGSGENQELEIIPQEKKNVDPMKQSIKDFYNDDESDEYAGLEDLKDTTQFLGALFKDPKQVAESNKFLAPDRTVRHIYQRVDAARDKFMQLHGELSEREANEDCGGIHRIAKSVVRAHDAYKLLATQVPHLTTDDQQAVATYVQERLGDISHTVSQQVVTAMMACETSQRDYAEAVAGISLMSRQIKKMRRRMHRTSATDCVKLQDYFHRFTTRIEDFHRRAQEKLAAMRSKNMVVAQEQAQLEIAARMAPSERAFYSTYRALWQRNCKNRVNVALGIQTGPSAMADAIDSAAVPVAAVAKSSVEKELKAVRGFSKLFQLRTTILDGSAAAATPPGASNNVTAAPAATPSPVITFPQAYPRTTRMLLFVATVFMAVCALIFLAMGYNESGDRLIHTVTFLFTAIAACSYFALYSGIGVGIKEDIPIRAILWARHFDLIVTLPLITLSVALFAKTDTGSTAAMMGTSGIIPFCWLIGASVFGDQKYSWWTISVIFFVISVVQYFHQINSARNRISELTVQTLQLLTFIVVLVELTYLIVYIVGSEGLGLITLTTEVGIFVFADLVGKVGFGFTILSSIDHSVVDSTGEQGRLLPSSRYV